VLVVHRKQHIRTFLSDVLEELGFMPRECSQLREFGTALKTQSPDLIILEVSAGGEDCALMLQTLARKEFGGKILLFGPGASPILAAGHEFGQKLGLAMLPVLSTPFGSEHLLDSVVTLLPPEPPPPTSLDVSEAISEGWLELWYQPKIDTRTLALSGAEALVRMRHPTWGIVTPGYFIPDEGDPQFSDLTEFVIDRAMRDWHDFLAQRGPVEIALNLPLAFFQRPEAVRSLCEKMPAHPAFKGLIVEINAAEIVRNFPFAKSVAQQLRFNGIGISIDDLGIEWPSLTGISDFPFVELKVDRKFVSGCADNPSMKTTCRRIVNLADGYGVRSVAEGVETTADFLAVRGMHFDLVQGFLFGKPMRANKFVHASLNRPITT